MVFLYRTTCTKQYRGLQTEILFSLTQIKLSKRTNDTTTYGQPSELKFNYHEFVLLTKGTKVQFSKLDQKKKKRKKKSKKSELLRGYVSPT